MQKIKNPRLLEIRTPDGRSCTGGNQEWYGTQWHRMAGCGPVAASNLVWYQSKSRENLRGMCESGDGGYGDFLKLMDAMFEYITPGRGGIHSSKLFIPGLLSFCRDRGFQMEADFLEVSRKPRTGPSRDEVRNYLMRWLENDCPVAFLNLSNGSLALPDSWHWVTILGLDSDNMAALVSDEGRTYEANIAEWLETSVLGGAFVTLYSPKDPVSE